MIPLTGAPPVPEKRDQTKRNVFLIDDHAVVRNGLTQLINLTPDLHVSGEAATAEEALEKIQADRPDIALVDLTLGDMNGLELIKHLKSRHPQLPLLVLSMHDESFYAERCLRAGAKGYIMKKEAIEQVEHAVRQILDGKIYLSQKMSDQFLLAVARGNPTRSGSTLDQLSDREL